MNQTRHQANMADINITPLVDVLLVLLIIFMMTVPVVGQKITLDLPQPKADIRPPAHPEQPIHLKIHASGQIDWNHTPVDEPEMRARMIKLAWQAIPPEIQIEGASNVPYETMAKVLADAKSCHLTRIGLIIARDR